MSKVSETKQAAKEVRIGLNREYRVLILVIEPDLIVVKVAYRKEVYE